ncbi:hypothetical protein [Thauera sp.]|uniref:hypothetical protein n=1 Tax=Thauera sp. TaxID=1905334 RepID=UPI0039E24F1B
MATQVSAEKGIERVIAEEAPIIATAYGRRAALLPETAIAVARRVTKITPARTSLIGIDFSLTKS